MGWLKRIFGASEPTVPPVQYGTPWEAIQAFIHDPQWQVEILEEQPGWVNVRFDNVVGELFDDPSGEWLQIRFRDPFTEAQRTSELEAYVGWTHHCSQHTLFRWDIDFERGEYYGDAFALFKYQYDQIECIRLAFNSAKLLREGSNLLALSHRQYYIGKRKRTVVGIALLDWLNSSLAPHNTQLQQHRYKESAYILGTAGCVILSEQWPYYTLFRFPASDFMKYMQQGSEMQLILYKMHLAIQRWFPHTRNFVLMTGILANNGAQETSMAILVSSGSHVEEIFDRSLKEVYNNLREFTEWLNFDFNEQTAPWFDHSRKHKEPGYVRDFQPRPFPTITEKYAGWVE